MGYTVPSVRPVWVQVLVRILEDSAHTDHITCMRFECSFPLRWIIGEYGSRSMLTVLNIVNIKHVRCFSFHSMTGDAWCDLLVAGPMSRPECHLRLDLAPADCGLLLSRVHNAEQLEELSLAIVSSFQYPVNLSYHHNTLCSVHDTVSFCL